jgi:hypothetical protein
MGRRERNVRCPIYLVGGMTFSSSDNDTKPRSSSRCIIVYSLFYTPVLPSPTTALAQRANPIEKEWSTLREDKSD